jgi:hypothetical protein
MKLKLGLMLLAVAFLPMGVSGCKTLNPVIRDHGPAVLQVACNLGVRAALYQSSVTIEDTNKIKSYLVDAKGLIDVGQPPAYALDQVAVLLNAKITSPIVRSAIQAAIVNLKSQVSLPVTGVISPDTKVWVLAVLNGAIDGCDAHIAGKQVVGSPNIGSDPVINFR